MQFVSLSLLEHPIGVLRHIKGSGAAGISGSGGAKFQPTSSSTYNMLTR